MDGWAGLWCGEQNLFCWLIDSSGWAEMAHETFGAGFFIWNFRVERRSRGGETVRFQVACRYHFLGDAVEVVKLRSRARTNQSIRSAEVAQTSSFRWESAQLVPARPLRTFPDFGCRIHGYSHRIKRREIARASSPRPGTRQRGMLLPQAHSQRPRQGSRRSPNQRLPARRAKNLGTPSE